MVCVIIHFEITNRRAGEKSYWNMSRTCSQNLWNCLLNVHLNSYGVVFQLYQCSEIDIALFSATWLPCKSDYHFFTLHALGEWNFLMTLGSGCDATNSDKYDWNTVPSIFCSNSNHRKFLIISLVTFLVLLSFYNEQIPLAIGVFVIVFLLG